MKSGIKICIQNLAVFATSAALMSGLVSCMSRNFNANEGGETQDVGPFKQCHWVYSKSNGLTAFKNAATHAGFKAEHNPFIVTSRRGLTARLVGTLSDEFMKANGNSMAAVVKKFPYLTPVKLTAVHNARREDRNVSPENRAVRGEVLKTTIVELPANSVMVVYPVSIATSGFNTLAGDWKIDSINREQFSNEKGPFGAFPFLLFTGQNEHAFHGPITQSPNESADMWRVKRGAVSHGCHRMQGEHVVELATLMGCSNDPKDKVFKWSNGSKQACPQTRADGLDRVDVHVLEEFDIIPKPELTTLANWSKDSGSSAGEYKGNWQDVLDSFVGVDIAFPRIDGQAKQASILAGQAGFMLEMTTVKRDFRNNDEKNKPFVTKREFPVWDNRTQNLVSGYGCTALK